MSFKSDFYRTISDFEYIKPHIEEKFNCRIISAEGEGAVAEQLDLRCGIDYLMIDKYGVKGLASRIQRGKSWRTFTVRAKKTSGAMTEYEKRCRAIQYGYMMPYWTMQAYITGNRVEFAICRTRELYEYIQTHEVKTNQTDNAVFYIVKWSEIPSLKFEFDIR